MKLKLYYRSPVVWNLALYIFLSFVFLYFQSLYLQNGSILNQFTMINFFENSIAISVFFLIAIFSLFTNLKRLNKICFIAVTSLTSLVTIYNLNQDFSKFLLIILFVYIIVSFYLYQFYSADAEEAYLNPLYDSNLLFSPMLRRIPIKITENGSEYSGYLSNWAEDSCFVYFEKGETIKNREVEVEINFLDSIFSDVGQIVSSKRDGTGIGLKFRMDFNSEKIDRLGWNQFCEIIDEMGYSPELLK